MPTCVVLVDSDLPPSQTKLNGVQTLIYDNSLPLTESDQEELKKRAKKRQFEVVEKLVQTPLDPTKKQVYLHFLKSPHQFNHGCAWPLSDATNLANDFPYQRGGIGKDKAQWSPRAATSQWNRRVRDY
jgi:hypothetical protein